MPKNSLNQTDINQADAYDTNSHAQHNDIERINQNTLELLAERPNIIKQVVNAGKITLQKHTRTRKITVPVELEETYLSIHLTPPDDAGHMLSGNYDSKDLVTTIEDDSAPILHLNGEEVSLDAPVEIVLSRQSAVITKTTHVVEEVSISTYNAKKTHSVDTTLRHEILHIDGEDYIKDTPLVQINKD